MDVEFLNVVQTIDESKNEVDLAGVYFVARNGYHVGLTLSTSEDNSPLLTCVVRSNAKTPEGMVYASDCETTYQCDGPHGRERLAERAADLFLIYTSGK